MENDLLRHAEEAIKRGEQSRILFEILLSHLGCNLTDSSLEDVYLKLKQDQDEYNEAVKMMALTLQEAKKSKKVKPEDRFNHPGTTDAIYKEMTNTNGHKTDT